MVAHVLGIIDYVKHKLINQIKYCPFYGHSNNKDFPNGFIHLNKNGGGEGFGIFVVAAQVCLFV